MNLSIDLDGVLANFNEKFAKLLISIYPPCKPEFRLDDESWPEQWGWDENVPKWARDQAWQEVKESGQFWRQLFPYYTAYEDIKYLNSIRGQHDIYFITTRRGKTAKAESEAWLEGLGYLKPTVLIAYDKAQLCQAMKIDLIIDDKPENLFGYVSGTERVLFKRPWNKDHWGKFRTVTTVREGLMYRLEGSQSGKI